MKKINATIICLIMYCFGTHSQSYNPIVTAAPLLSITPDARAAGMGDVGTATSADINSQYWNPAKYVFMETSAGISINYTPWLSSIGSKNNMGSLSGFYKLSDKQSVSTSIRYFSMGNFDILDVNGISQGTAHPNELAIDAAYSLLLSDKFSTAITMRFISSNLNNGINAGNSTEMFPGSALAADVSAYYKTNVSDNESKKLAIGINISNIGSKISYDKGTTTNFLPAKLRIGTSYNYAFDATNQITVSCDVSKLLVPTKGTMSVDEYNKLSPIAGIFKSFGDAPDGFSEELKEIMWSVGAEYIFNNQFFVRTGYHNENEYKGNRKFFSAGAGFKYNQFTLDAAYLIAATATNPLDKTLRLSLSMDL